MMTKAGRNKSRDCIGLRGYSLYITLKESVNLPAGRQDPIVNTMTSIGHDVARGNSRERPQRG